MKMGFAGALAVSVIVLGGLTFLLKPDESAISSRGALKFYCAAGIRKPVVEIIEDYEKQYGVTFETVYKGSGDLKTDIRVAGGDVYLAADVTYLEEVREMGLAREIVPIARQHPVIVVRKGNEKQIRGLDDLKREDVEVSLADPDRAAVSKVTKRLLGSSETWELIWKNASNHGVQRGTVNEVANDVAKLNSADAGIIWNATAVQAEYKDKLDIIPVQELASSPNQITIGVLESSKQPTRALHFVRYMTSRDKGLNNFKKYGYEVVDGDMWAERPELLVFSGGLNRPAIEQTIEDFQEREGVTVLVTAAGCGTLVGQMKAGERPDMYFACDTLFMDNVKDLFLDATDVSQTDMVIITGKGNEHGIQRLEDLQKQGLKIALCDPQKSALGKLSEDLLKKYGILDGVLENRQATSSTAPELVQNVVVGGLDAAIVYKANTTLQVHKLEVIPIDDDDATAVQPIAVGKNSDFPQLTTRLMQDILSAESRESFRKFGFKWLVEP